MSISILIWLATISFEYNYVREVSLKRMAAVKGVMQGGVGRVARVQGVHQWGAGVDISNPEELDAMEAARRGRMGIGGVAGVKDR